MSLELNGGNISLILMLIGNLCALVWGAATIKSSILRLSDTTKDMRETLDGLAKTQSLHSAEILVLKSDTKKAGEEVIMNRARMHELSSDVLQPMLILVNTLAEKVTRMTIQGGNND